MNRSSSTSLNENERIVYERVLALGKQSGMRIKWGLKGFTPQRGIQWGPGHGLLRLPAVVRTTRDIYTRLRPRMLREDKRPA